ncbi:VOC family protein [Streptomyces winkii]
MGAFSRPLLQHLQHPTPHGLPSLGPDPAHTRGGLPAPGSCNGARRVTAAAGSGRGGDEGLPGGLGFTLMGADTPPGMEHSPGNNFSVSLSGDDEDELRGYWEKLSAGGSVSVPLEKQMWGDVFGMCTDRFGISWMVDIGRPQS